MAPSGPPKVAGILSTPLGEVTVLDYLEALGDEAVARARASPKFARILLVGLAEKLAANVPMTSEERNYLAAALLTTVEDPARAGIAFGLKQARRGTPGHTKSERFARLYAGRLVLTLRQEQGVPVEDAKGPKGDWDGRGAITRVAEDRGLSPDQVRRGYREYRQLRDAVFDRS